MDAKEIITIVGALGAGLGIKHVWPIITDWVKGIMEVKKIKAKNNVGNHGEVANIWKQQYDECKEELNQLKEKQIHLEVKVATLKERLSRYAKEHGVVLSVKPKNEKPN